MYCITNTNPRPAVSAAKANRLYWLGRYAERVYLSLHFMRKYADRMVDGDSGDFAEYYTNLDIDDVDRDKTQLNLDYMYDSSNPASILSGLVAANDNAILLREEIKSETLSYIQMSLCHIRHCAELGESNITALQPVTDYILAFWGSVDSRPVDPQARCLIRVGKLVEDADMHIRFGYPYERIMEYCNELQQLAAIEPGVFDAVTNRRLREILSPGCYGVNGSSRRDLISALGQVVTI